MYTRTPAPAEKRSPYGESPSRSVRRRKALRRKNLLSDTERVRPPSSGNGTAFRDHQRTMARSCESVTKAAKALRVSHRTAASLRK